MEPSEPLPDTGPGPTGHPGTIPPAYPLFVIPAFGLLLVLQGLFGIAGARPERTSLASLEGRVLPLPGIPVTIDGGYVAVALHAEPEADRRTGKPAHYVAFDDGSTKQVAILRLARPPAGDATRGATRNSETITGMARTIPADVLADVTAGADAAGIDLGTPTILLREGELPGIPVARMLLGLVGGAIAGVGTFTYRRHRTIALESAATVLPRIAPVEPLAPSPVMPSDASSISRASESAAYRQAIAQAPCGVCGATIQGFMKLCPNCKLPRQIEYFVSATIPLTGFEKHNTTITKELGESEYQVARTLARPHMAIPFVPISSLRERFQGGTSTSIHRLIAKGQASYMKVQRLKEELSAQELDVVTISSEELALAAKPVPARGATATLDGMTFLLDNDRVETFRYEDIYLLIVYGGESAAETLTRGGGTPSASTATRRNLLDVYARTSEAALRIFEDTFSWDVLAERKGSSPEANFGHLIDMLESRSPEAVVHQVIDAHHGAWSEWRATWYSLWRSIAARRGADKGRGRLTIEGYRILGELGKGAWGRVYKAVQERVERTVAIKVLSSQFPRDEKFRERFLREARMAGQINHPNAVAVIDCNEQRGLHYLVMEFVDGLTLKDVVRNRGPLPEEQAVRAVKAVARALEHAHAKNIVHRDIKPENIFLGRDGHVKLGDWGLAKTYVGEDANLTDTGAAMGTPNYISPEQVKAVKDVDHRADIYALGATLYFLLTGQPPFAAPTVVEIMTRHLRTPPPDPRAISPTVSEATVKVIHRAMAKDPAARYQSATELLAALS